MRFHRHLLNRFLATLLVAGAIVLGIGSARSGQILNGVRKAGVASITCSGTCWATVDCASAVSCDSASTAQTITNGTNNVLLFTMSPNLHSAQYSDNGGSFTAFSSGGTITWTTGHTLSIKVQSLNCGGEQETVTVKDNVTGVTIGTFIGKNTGIC